MKLEFYVPPRLERRIKKMAIKSEFAEIWDFMARYGMTGWYYYLGNTNIDQMHKDLECLDRDVDYIISVGTGGSYQGIELLLQFSENKDKFIFVGPSLEPEEIKNILEKIEGKRVGFNIISKSGSTLEIMIFINLFKKNMQKADWISVVSSNPYFIDFIQENFKSVSTIKSFNIAKDIGGRFSIVSSMGVVASYLAGIDYNQLLTGFLNARKELEEGENLAPLERGISRYLLFSQGKVLENLTTNLKKVVPTLKWAKQLWAESNGKEYKSMFVTTGYYPEDAHSVGQIWKEGPRKVAETYYLLDKNGDLNFDTDLSIGQMKIKLNSMAEINNNFIEAIVEDRFECGIPVTVYRMNEFNLTEWGHLIFSEMVGVVMEAFLLGVNPFNQPGVESYKKKVQERIL